MKTATCNEKIVVGSTVEYPGGVEGKIQVKVLEVKADGKLILDTKRLGLIKNVCVLSHRVKLIN